jgi:hypothetical protein
MDKSRQYIQMCKRSKEIQNLWQPKAGDFYVDSGSKVLCWIPGSPKAPSIRKGFAVVPGDKVTRISPMYWLPKLDQLIETSQFPGSGFRDISFVFYEWVKVPYGPDAQPANKFFTSLEQLWLAFIMVKKFSKIWESGEWLPH